MKTIENLKKKLNLKKRIIRKIRSDIRILKDYFKNDIYVLDGPFKGMLYGDVAYGSSLLPKVFGTYEQHIHPWIEEIIDKKYKKILNIGCAEGYFSSGFAIRNKDSQIYAYDTNKEALKTNREIVTKNKIENVILKEECTIKELENLIDENAFIFCDIEGGEIDLIDPRKSKKLLEADYIIETHDFKLDGITEEMVNRFKDTHEIEVISDDNRKISDNANACSNI